MVGLSASNLTCIKRDRVLFSELSLSVSPGELLYLRGPNGAGKTSLLRILTGLSQADNGDVFYNGEPISAPEGQYQKALVYLGHKSGLNSMLSALENLAYWTAQHRIDVTKSTLYGILEKLGLVGLEEIPIKMLSAGQQRRVALGRLWLKSSTIWILDEPFTALDVAGVALLEKQFKRHVEQGGIVLTTSHQALSDEAGPYRTFDLEYRI